MPGHQAKTKLAMSPGTRRHLPGPNTFHFVRYRGTSLDPATGTVPRVPGYPYPSIPGYPGTRLRVPGVRSPVPVPGYSGSGTLVG
eukprot:1691939-Rhodomonas_salina.1